MTKRHRRGTTTLRHQRNPQSCDRISWSEVLTGAADLPRFFPFDQLHNRGMKATREHIERARYQFEHAVDGAEGGVGNCSRVIATAYGCRTIGIDLTVQIIGVARAR